MKKAAMIKEEFGDQSLQIVKRDPFQLCKIKGFGFMTVDSIARKTKVSLKHPMRYCLTIHKSQGQEYPVIIVPLLKEHYIMLRRNLLYTAVTRAKAKVILIGQRQAVYIAIHKCDVGQRNTVLADRIVAYYNREMSKRVA